VDVQLLGTFASLRSDYKVRLSARTHTIRKRLNGFSWNLVRRLYHSDKYFLWIWLSSGMQHCHLHTGPFKVMRWEDNPPQWRYHPWSSAKTDDVIASPLISSLVIASSPWKYITWGWLDEFLSAVLHALAWAKSTLWARLMCLPVASFLLG
jgi:hypothetical protein